MRPLDGLFSSFRVVVFDVFVDGCDVLVVFPVEIPWRGVDPFVRGLRLQRVGVRLLAVEF